MAGRIFAQVPRWLGVASALFGAYVVLTADIPDRAAKRRVISGVTLLLSGVGLVSSGTHLLYKRDHTGKSQPKALHTPVEDA